MAGLELVGDTIEFDSRPVARLSPDCIGSFRGRVEEAINNAYEDEDKELKPFQFDDLMQSIKNAAIAKAEAKMITLDELDAIIEQITKGEI